MFKLKDTKNEDVKGRYYAAQLWPAPDPTKISYEIEKILATRKRKNKTEYLGIFYIKFKLLLFRNLNVLCLETSYFFF